MTDYSEVVRSLFDEAALARASEKARRISAEALESLASIIDELQKNLDAAAQTIADLYTKKAATDYDALVKDLREEAEWAEANEWETPIMLSDHLKQAADAIEELFNTAKELQHEIDMDSDIIRELDSARPRWISVDDELPEEGRRVLVCFDVVILVAYQRTGKWFEVLSHEMLFPTHWMPMPETPKEETKCTK